MIQFVDISYAQGAYNMAANSDPMVMMKASGFYTSAKTPYLDAQLVSNYANAKKYNKTPFLYHFAGGADPLTEAKYFIRAVSPLAVGDGYALDFEIDIPNPVEWVLIFVQQVHDATGCYPWVYIDRSRREAHDWSPVFNLCSEWIAAPDVSFDANIPGVGVYVAQQGPIINGVDTDEYFGSLESLRSYLYGYKPQASTPQPEPAPSPVPTPPAAPVPAPTPVPEPVTPAVPDPQPVVEPAPAPDTRPSSPAPVPKAPPQVTVVTGPTVPVTPGRLKQVILALIGLVMGAVAALWAALHS
jgi:hypothetical protein